MAVLVPLENERGEGAGHSPRQRARTQAKKERSLGEAETRKATSYMARERKRERERKGSSLDLPWRRTKKGKGKWRQRAGHASSSLWSRLDPCFCHATTVNEPIGTPALLFVDMQGKFSQDNVWKRNVFNPIELEKIFSDNFFSIGLSRSYTRFEQFFYYFLSLSLS